MCCPDPLRLDGITQRSEFRDHVVPPQQLKIFLLALSAGTSQYLGVYHPIFAPRELTVRASAYAFE